MCGYSFTLLVDPSQIQDRHKCRVCRLVVNRPVQYDGCMFCRTCMFKVCPNYGKDSRGFEDRACCREVMAMSVYCAHRTDGCKWVGCLKHLQIHNRSCGYKPFQSSYFHNQLVQCLFCDQFVEAKSLLIHVKRVCPRIARNDNKTSSSELKCTYSGACKIYSIFSGTPTNIYKLRDPHYKSCYLPAYGAYDPDLCFEEEWEEASSVEDVDDKLHQLISSMRRDHLELTQDVLKSLFDTLDFNNFSNMVTSPYVCTTSDDFKSFLSRSSNGHPIFQTVFRECLKRIDLCNWCDISCLSTLLKLSHLSPALVEREQKLLNQFELRLYTNLARLSYLLQARQILSSKQPTDLQSNEQRWMRPELEVDLSGYNSSRSSFVCNPLYPVPRAWSMKMEQDAVFVDGDELASDEEILHQ